MESLSISSQVLVKLLNKKPGIKDNNVQIQKLRLECLKKVVEKFPITRLVKSLLLLISINLVELFSTY